MNAKPTEMEKPIRIYIAGKVSGEEENSVFVKFMAAESRLKLDGYEPVNPLRICSKEWSWQECMRHCITQLMTCDAIYMLADYKGSRGARLEHFIALKMGLKIINE